MEDGLGVLPLIVPLDEFKDNVEPLPNEDKLELEKTIELSGSEALISNKPVPVTSKFLEISNIVFVGCPP